MGRRRLQLGEHAVWALSSLLLIPCGCFDLSSRLRKATFVASDRDYSDLLSPPGVFYLARRLVQQIEHDYRLPPIGCLRMSIRAFWPLPPYLRRAWKRFLCGICDPLPADWL